MIAVAADEWQYSKNLVNIYKIPTTQNRVSSMTEIADLVVTFPCYSIVRQTHPCTVTTDHGELSILICTDHDIFADIFDSFGNTEEFGRMTADTPIQLAAFLDECKRHLWNSGPITHVIVDPKPGALAFQVYPIDAFREHILR